MSRRGALAAAAAAALVGLVALALAACSSEQPFLSFEAPQVCRDVRFAEEGQPCNFPDLCIDFDEHVGPIAPSCCTSYTACPEGELSIDYHCNSPCQICRSDSDCAAGVDVCGARGLCVPCPLEARCPQCPPWQVHARRNGCAMCECVTL